jgi:hypothetical protein
MIAVPWIVTLMPPRVTNIASAPIRAAFQEVIGMRSTVLPTGEPLAHQVRAFTAVRDLFFVHAAVIDRAAFHTGIRRQERFSFRCFAPGSHRNTQRWSLSSFWP